MLCLQLVVMHPSTTSPSPQRKNNECRIKVREKEITSKHGSFWKGCEPRNHFHRKIIIKEKKITRNKEKKKKKPAILTQFSVTACNTKKAKPRQLQLIVGDKPCFYHCKRHVCLDEGHAHININ